VRRILLLICTLVLLVGAAPAHARAQGFAQIAFNTVTADVTLTTTTEAVIVSSGPVTLPREVANVCVIGWAQLTTGTNTTAVTPAIRRGTTITGTLVGEANAETIMAAAGSTEPKFYMACEERSGVATVDYSFTLKQTGASANGSALSGSIIVFAR
jgi:hypothetical protein